MSEQSPYVPVACVLHERLEFAVLRRLTLQLRWTDETGSHADSVQPLDVTTRDGAEWLLLRRPDGEVMEVRLDHIEALDEAPSVCADSSLHRRAPMPTPGSGPKRMPTLEIQPDDPTCNQVVEEGIHV